MRDAIVLGWIGKGCDMVKRTSEYRVTSFNKPVGPWRADREDARRDAIMMRLGRYDRWGQYYDVVPGDIERREVGTKEPA